MCKTSRQVVDQVLSEFATSSEEVFRVSNESTSARYLGSFHPIIKSINNSYVFTTQQDVERFTRALNLNTEHFDCDQNPFITRSIQIFCIHFQEVLTDEQVFSVEQYFLSLHSLLSSYGHHIQRLEYWIRAKRRMMERIQALDKFIALLKLLPNFKILKIESSSSMIGHQYQYHLDQLNLNQLEYLDVGHGSSDLIDDLIEKCGNQITTLGFQDAWLRCDITDYKAEELSSSLPNLRRLHVEGIKELSLRILAATDWPLEVFLFSRPSLHYISEGVPKLLIKTISNFGQSLIRLAVLADLTKSGDVSASTNSTQKSIEEFKPMLQLKTLVSLVKNMGASWFWNDFILTKKCENLEEIYFIMEDINFERHMETAQLAFGVLPKLNKIVFTYDPLENDQEMKRVVLRRPKESSNKSSSQSGV